MIAVEKALYEQFPDLIICKGIVLKQEIFTFTAILNVPDGASRSSFVNKSYSGQRFGHQLITESNKTNCLANNYFLQREWLTEILISEFRLRDIDY